MQLTARQTIGQPSRSNRTRWPSHRPRRIELVDFSSRPVPYETTWKWQKSKVAQLVSDADRRSSEALMLVQHEPVYTLGAASSLKNLKCDPAALPHPIFRTERGGEVTYHGPGQLVLYPILDLHNYRRDLHWYMHQLEEVAIAALMEVSSIEGERIQGLTGVWIRDSKVAAIGIRATRWVTYHGLALNVATDLGPFRHIVPCGISNRGVTSVDKVLGQQRSSLESAEKLMKTYRHALLRAFSKVFVVELESVTSPDHL